MNYDPELLRHLTPEEQAELFDLVDNDPTPWRPIEGPQLRAFHCEADIIGYGGAAGGGKTDLICGLCLTKHHRALVVRREKTQTEGIIQRMEEILGTRNGYSSQNSKWRLPGGRLTEFGGLDNPGDERKWQGRAHDLKALDEVTEMREAQVRFIIGWKRTNREDVPCRVLMTFNPPTTTEGKWVLNFFGPWLDKRHPNPAKPGELRWFTTIDGTDFEVDGPEEFVLDGMTDDGKPIMRYDFNPDDYEGEDLVKIIRPQSRTFIPARVVDNPYYMNTGYVSTLQAMPEPLRTQMLYGDFLAGVEDDEMQVIPTAWVELAMERWEKREVLPDIHSLGVDVAMGGRDKTIIIARGPDMRFEMPVEHAGRACKDGPTVAGFVVAAMRGRLPSIHIDLFGVGAKPYGTLMAMQLQVLGINFGDPAPGTDVTGHWTFDNLRSMWWWKMREALDPDQNTGIALPPSKPLLADLTAIKWQPQGRRIVVEKRKDIVKRLGRSLDHGTACILALMDTPRRQDIRDQFLRAKGHDMRGHDPLDAIRNDRNWVTYDHDPLENLR